MASSPPASASASEPSTSVPVTPAASTASDVSASLDELRPDVDVVARPAKRPRRTTKKREPKPLKAQNPDVHSPESECCYSYSCCRCCLHCVLSGVLVQTEIEELTDEMKRLKKQMEYYAYRNEILKQREALIERENVNKTCAMPFIRSDSRLQAPCPWSRNSSYVQPWEEPMVHAASNLVVHLATYSVTTQQSLLIYRHA